MTQLPQAAFARVLPAALAAALFLQPLAAYPRDHHADAGGGSDPGAESGQAEHHADAWTTRAAWRGTIVPDYVAYPATGIYHCRDGAATASHCGGTANSNGASSASLHALPSLYDPPVRSADYNECFLRSHDRLYAGKEGRWHEPSVPGVGHHVRGVRGPPSTSMGSTGYPGANGSGTINLTTGYPDTIWCWNVGAPTAADKLHRGRQRIRLSPQWPCLQPRNDGAATQRQRSPAGTTIRTASRDHGLGNDVFTARRNANSSTRSPSTAIRTTTPFRRSSTVRPRTPPAGERRPA